MQHFYDKQIRRYLLQFVRIFGAFTVQKGLDNTGLPIYDRVPARYGDMTRNVGHIIKNNSENVLNTVPFISCYVAGLSILPNLRRYPQFEERIQVVEKQFDEETHQYNDEAGQSYTVTRYQPVPYNLTMTVDIWSSNTDQKLQLLEQILVLFNPGINLHTNQNALDWTALTYCELTDVNWSTRTLPSGADEVIDVATLTFEMPVLINPPTKVQRANLINTILTQMHVLEKDDFDDWSLSNLGDAWTDYNIITLENYEIRFENNQALLLERDGDDKGGVGTALTWDDVLDNYGEVRPGISQIRLRQGNDVTDPNNDVIGTISIDPDNPQKLAVIIDNDTLPADTQGTVTAIVNPQVNGPGDGTLAAAISGQRYLVLSDVPTGGLWGSVVANDNDIIEYNGSNWVVSFDSSANVGLDYVTNLATGEQFEWTGEYWQHSFEGTYRAGWWRIYI